MKALTVSENLWNGKHWSKPEAESRERTSGRVLRAKPRKKGFRGTTKVASK